MKETIKKMRDAFNMTKQRCYNPKCRDYQYYGGRGITICQRWLDSFDALVTDMGLRPTSSHTLERVDNNGPYSKENCVWALRQDQMQNTRQVRLVTYKGETKTIAEWERVLGFKSGTLKARLSRLGYTVEEAFTKDVKCGGLLPGKVYAHLEDQSWRTTEGLRRHPKPKKLTPNDVAQAKEWVAQGLTRSEVSRRFHVCVTTISHAVDGKGNYRA